MDLTDNRYIFNNARELCNLAFRFVNKAIIQYIDPILIQVEHVATHLNTVLDATFEPIQTRSL